MNFQQLKKIIDEKVIFEKNILVGCLIGIDFGIKRTGLSHTDPNNIIASGLKNLPTKDVISFLKAQFKIEDIESFVIGKPLQKDGSPSDLEYHIKDFIELLKQNFPNQKIERYDERFTSKIAFNSMVEGGLKKHQLANKGLIDQISATIILQSYLDHKMNSL